VAVATVLPAPVAGVRGERDVSGMGGTPGDGDRRDSAGRLPCGTPGAGGIERRQRATYPGWAGHTGVPTSDAAAYRRTVPMSPHPSPPPLRVDTARVVHAGMVVWAAALVVLLVLGDRVDRVWTWTCVAALVLAVLGLALMRWQGAGKR
jgi:hypothetical protein